MSKVSHEQLTALYRRIIEQYNLEELRTLCFDLGVAYDSLPGEGKDSKARELVTLLNRQRRIPELEQAIGRPRSTGKRIPARRPFPLDRPRRAEHFVGRQDELDQLVQALQPGQVVTLCGPGGIGKTALAAEVIWRLAPDDQPPTRFPDGIFFYTFYHQPQAALALEAIARAFGQDPRPNPAAAAQRVLSGRRALVILNGAEAADNLEAVLAVTASCGVLITTRRHSDAPAGWQDLRPLPADQAGALLQAWAGACADDVVAVEQICALVGGLPLAIRLIGRYLAQRGQAAADYLAWLNESSLAALDMDNRQRESVPLLLEHSLAHISKLARHALAVAGRLAQSPFARELVAVALDESPTEVERSLGELINYGLMFQVGEDYQVSHSLVRTYARQQLPMPADAMSRAARYYDTLAREQHVPGAANRYAVLDGQRVHIMAVLEACVASEVWEPARRLAWAIENYLDIQAHLTERLTVCQVGLAAARHLGHRRDEGAFLTNLGLAYADLEDVQQAIAFYKQALAIDREIGDRRGERTDLSNLGLTYAGLGNARQAIAFYKQALAIDREIGEWCGEAVDLSGLRHAYQALGDWQQAMAIHEQASAVERKIRDRQAEKALSIQNMPLTNQEEVQRAIELYTHILTSSRKIRDRSGETIASWNLGLVYEKQSDLARAVELMQVRVDYEREIGHPDADKHAAEVEAIRARIK